MQPNVSRAALRALSRPSALSQTSRHTTRRNYAEIPGDISKGNTSASQSNIPGGRSSKVPIFVIGAVVFAMVGGRYMLASSKTPGAGNAESTAIRREKGRSEEYRDPRDSAVKTLAQKKERDEKANQSS